MKPDAMGFELTPLEVTDANTKLDDLIKFFTLKKNFELTKDERKELQTISEVRYPYVRDTFETLAPANPKCVPAFADLPTETKNYNYQNQVRSLMPKAVTLLRVMTDHGMMAESFAYGFLRHFYDTAIEAVEAGVTGAQVVVDALAPLFARESETGSPEPAPTP